MGDDDPVVAESMVRLYKFFRQCGKSTDDAEVCVALLRNTFWTKYGVPDVDFVKDGPDRGCKAVRDAVRAAQKRRV